MDATLGALGDILLKALPTFVLVLILHFFLRRVFFEPLGKVLEARRQATEGSRRRAEEILQQAEQKTAAYEASLEAARAGIRREQEAERRKALQQGAAQLQQARQQAENQLLQARSQIDADGAAARESLAAQTHLLAERIIQAVLSTGVAA